MSKVSGTCSNGIAYTAAAGCTGAGGTWTANTETWSAGAYLAAKGGMGLQGSATSPSVLWRLPTIYDYKIADANGIRMVLPDMGNAGGFRPVVDASTGGINYEWSASVYSSMRGFAWIFYGYRGGVESHARSLAYVVRCVGR